MTIRRVGKLISFDMFLSFVWLIAPMIPLFNSYFPLVFRLGIFMLWLFVVILKYRNFMKFWIARLFTRQLECFLLFLFVIVVAINYFFRSSNPNAQLYFAHFSLMFIALIMSSFYEVIDQRKRLIILFFTVFLFGVQAIVSIPHLLGGYNIRESLGFAGADMTRDELLDRAKRGIGSQYMYLSLAPMVFSAMGLSVFFAKLYKRIIYLSVIGIICSLILCTFFGAVVLLFLGFLFIGFVFRKNLVRFSVLKWLVLIILSAVYIYTMFLQGQNYFSSLEFKINGYIQAFATKGLSPDSDVTGRTGLAAISFQTFAANPLFGIGVPPLHSYDIVGEHMPWIDYFAYFGILGFLPLLLFFSLLFLRNRKLYTSFLRRKRHSRGMRDVAFYNLMLGISFLLFVISNFISPLLTVPQTYLLLIFWYSNPLRPRQGFY